MGMRRMFWPRCDSCEIEDEGYADPYAGNVRDKMKADGWTVSNKLICPACNGHNTDWWSD